MKESNKELPERWLENHKQTMSQNSEGPAREEEGWSAVLKLLGVHQRAQRHRGHLKDYFIDWGGGAQVHF